MGNSRGYWQRKKAKIFARDNYTCQYCLKPIDAALLTLDHVKPKARGGTSANHNLVAACGSCNSRKADKGLHELAISLEHKDALSSKALGKKTKWVMAKLDIFSTPVSKSIGLGYMFDNHEDDSPFSCSTYAG